MTNEYELADDNRADLIYEKSDLLAPLLPGMEQPPHPMRLGDDEGDYYRGAYAAPAPAPRREAGAVIAFWILAPIMVIAALGILFVRKAVHAALLLAVVMISLAVLYAALEAPFLFAVQIIVYTGAILMLFLFVLMLVGVDASDSVVETIRGQRVLAIVGRPAARRSCSSSALGQITLGTARRARRGQRRRQRPGARQHPVLPLRLRLRGHQRAADHRRGRRDGARPPRAAHARSRRRPTWPPSGCATTPTSGTHPGPLPPPGVFARHNAVDTPALLPDGTAAEASVSRVLAARGTVRSAPALADDIEDVQRQLGRRRARRTTGPAPRPRTEEDAAMSVTPYIVLSAILFTIGCVGRADPAQRDRGVHVRRADAQRLATSRSSRSPSSTATSTARSRRSS